MLGIDSATLPFPRGSTMNADGLLTLGDTGLQEYEGKTYEVPDTVHKTGINPQLIVLKNDTGGAITVARKFMRFAAATALDAGRRIGTFPNDVEGGVCIALDDAYTVGGTIADNDLFYGLCFGWCNIATQGVGNFAAHMRVASSALGYVRDLADVAAGGYAVGRLAYAASYGANSTVVVGIDCRSFVKGSAAG